MAIEGLKYYGTAHLDLVRILILGLLSTKPISGALILLIWSERYFGTCMGVILKQICYFWGGT